RSRQAPRGSRRSRSTISRRSSGSSRARAASRYRCSSVSCRCTRSATPSSCTTRCRASRCPTPPARGCATPVSPPCAPASRWRRRWWPRFGAAMPARISCRRSDASRWSRRCSMRSTELGVRAVATALRAGEVTAAALVNACLDRIRAVDPTVKAWIHVDDAGARAAARAADAAVRPGATLGPLHGVPIGVKDIIDVAGMPTTAGARALAHTRPTRDATCVARLRAAGAIVLGKTHTTQFAYRDPAPTANPWNPPHTPGRSSSRSAAAGAARPGPEAPRLAVARELFDRAAPELLKHLEGVIARLATAGARVEEVRLPPSFANLAEAALVILETEAAAYHEPAFAKHASDYGRGMAEM